MRPRGGFCVRHTHPALSDRLYPLLALPFWWWRRYLWWRRKHDVVGTTESLALTNRFRDGAIGQVGGGFEVRFTPHIGWINDFSWNVVDGPKNNFGMVRTGVNFAF